MFAILVLLGLSLGCFHINQAITRKQKRHHGGSARTWPRL